nr:MAG TPA: hypothetical protein [Caudoviricetes sp.]
MLKMHPVIYKGHGLNAKSKKEKECIYKNVY